MILDGAGLKTSKTFPNMRLKHANPVDFAIHCFFKDLWRCFHYFNSFHYGEPTTSRDVYDMLVGSKILK